MTSVVRFEEWQEPTGTSAATVDGSGNVTFANDVTVSGTVTSTGNPQGLTFIKSQAIGSGVSSMTVTGAFSATFDNYQVTYSGGTASLATTMFCQLGASTTSYNGFLVYGANTSNTVLGAARRNDAAWAWVGGSRTNNQHVHCNFTLFSPNLAQYTKILNASWQDGINYGTLQGEHEIASAYTDFTLFALSGTVTGGTIRVYGYNNG